MGGGKIRFGDCVFDGATRQLARSGCVVALSPKAFDLLGALLAERPRALSKARLQEILWPRTFVSETSLARLVSEVRQAIGDRPGRPAFVRTVHRFGYAFSGAAEALDEAPSPAAGPSSCWLVWAGQRVPLPSGEHVVGRGGESVVPIDSPWVSRQHCRIAVERDRAVLEDLGSKNGTYVGGRRVEGTVALSNGDEIRIGPFVILFRAGPDLPSTDTQLRL